MEIVFQQGKPVGGGDGLAGGIGGGTDPGDHGEVFAAIGDLIAIRQRARGEQRGLREGAAEQEVAGERPDERFQFHKPALGTSLKGENVQEHLSKFSTPMRW